MEVRVAFHRDGVLGILISDSGQRTGRTFFIQRIIIIRSRKDAGNNILQKILGFMQARSRMSTIFYLHVE